MIILGIDPGSRRIGYGLIQKDRNMFSFLDAGILSVKKKSDQEIFLEIRNGIHLLIKKFKPELMAIEKLYFAKNRKTGIQVAEARGVILLSAAEKDLAVKEYAPNEVKSNVAGYGFADKNSVAKMVKLILRAPHLDLIDDATDALAVAITAGSDRVDKRTR